MYLMFDETSQETHYVSATEPNRLMLFGETVAVYCENHKERRVDKVTAHLEVQRCLTVWPADINLESLYSFVFV
jgi:hypothetical protein